MIRKFILLFSILISFQIQAIDLAKFGINSAPEDILSAIQKDEFLRPHFTYESAISNLANKLQCLPINYSLHKGEKSRAHSPFKQVIDIPVSEISTNQSKRFQEDLSELNALVSAGIFNKDRIQIRINEVDGDYDRYRLTVKGFKSIIREGRSSYCLNLGKAKHLSVKDVKEKQISISKDEKVSIYEVTTIVGFPRDYELPDWVNHPEMRKAFPLINKLVNGYETTIRMEQNWGQWQEYLSPSTIARMEKSGKSRSTAYFEPRQAKISTKEFLKVFDVAELTGHSSGCLELPGNASNGAKVDKQLSSRNDYSVAIYSDKPRESWDTIETKTKPYLDRMVNSGLLVSYVKRDIPGEKKEKGQYFTGTVYKLAPEYKHIIDEQKDCIYLGQSEIEIVDFQITPGYSRELPFEDDSFHYKLIIKFPNPPEWARDPVLQAWWRDLKGALEFGRACEGQFAIDLENDRKMSGGSGSCWWAYDNFATL